MLFDINLKLVYRYQSAVGGSRHHLRIRPRAMAGVQQVLNSTLMIDPPPSTRSAYEDFFGNHVDVFASSASHDTLTVSLRARVDIHRPSASVQAALPEQVIAGASRYHSLDADSPHHFLHDGVYSLQSDEITQWAGESLRPDESVSDLAADLARRIHETFHYDGAATDVSTTSLEAFALKRGVCQDFSHVMIAGLRGLGIPASYVSGCLRTDPPAGKPRLEGADAMHAWVRVWCGAEAGWRDFDPTNGIAAGNDHIVFCHGRDFADVTPILGIVKTAGAQAGSQSVDVVPVSQ